MIDSPTLVRQLHVAMLGRAPDAGEENLHLQKIAEDGGIRNCVTAIMHMAEFRSKHRPRPIFAIVAHEFGRYNGHGGIAVYLENLVDALIANSDYHVHLFCHGLGPYRANPRLTVTRLPGGDLDAAAIVAQELERIDPDFVEVADYNGLASQFLLAREMGRTTSRCRVIVNHHTGSREIWEWGTLTDFDARAERGFRFTAIAEDIQNRLADGHVSVSAFLARYLEKCHGLGPITPLYPCFPSAERPTSKSMQPPRSPVFSILSLGRFELRKRQDLLVRACVELLHEGANLHLTFVGNSIDDFRSGQDFRSDCFALIDRDLRDHFSFHDFLPPAASRPLFEEADLFVIPSPRENFPTTALEAIAHGLPVSGSRTSGVAELTGDDDSLLFAPDDVAAIKNVLRHAMNIDMQDLRTIAQQQWDRARAMLEPTAALQARLAGFRDIPEHRARAFTALPDIALIVPTATASDMESLTRTGVTLVHANRPLHRHQMGDAPLFLYCPSLPTEETLEALLALARDAAFLTEHDLLCCARTLTLGLDKTEMLRQRICYPLIGRLRAGSSAMVEGRAFSRQVADILLRVERLFYAYCPQAQESPMDRSMQARLDQCLFPFIDKTVA